MALWRSFMRFRTYHRPSKHAKVMADLHLVRMEIQQVKRQLRESELFLKTEIGRASLEDEMYRYYGPSPRYEGGY